MALLTSILDDISHKQPLLVLQSSLAQSCLPVLREILARSAKGPSRHNLLFCLLYPPSSLVDTASPEALDIYNWIDRVPGYNDADDSTDLVAIIEKALEAPTSPHNIVIDSIDTLLQDSGSLSATYKSLSKIMALVKKHPDTRLILHSQSPSSLLPLITQTAFSSSLAHVIAHPTALIAHIATEFLMPPPPVSPLPKFWSVFLPVSERLHDTERLVFGAGGEGSSNPAEFVVELIIRESAGRKRGIERVVEGWSVAANGPCELSALDSLKHLSKKPELPQSGPDPTQNLPFNLSLTSSQQESRAQVPLPYAHEGNPVPSTLPTAAIFYDPDSADDIDDDDPDEDLDI